MALGYIHDDYVEDGYLVRDCVMEFFRPDTRVGWGTVRGPASVNHRLTPLQSMARTAGNVRYGQASVAHLEIVEMAWEGMDETEAAELQTFFATHAEGILYEFDWYNYGDNSVTRATFAVPTLTLTERLPGTRDVALSLLVQT